MSIIHTFHKKGLDNSFHQIRFEAHPTNDDVKNHWSVIYTVAALANGVELRMFFSFDNARTQVALSVRTWYMLVSFMEELHNLSLEGKQTFFHLFKSKFYEQKWVASNGFTDEGNISDADWQYIIHMLKSLPHNELFDALPQWWLLSLEKQ